MGRKRGRPTNRVWLLKMDIVDSLIRQTPRFMLGKRPVAAKVAKAIRMDVRTYKHIRYISHKMSIDELGRLADALEVDPQKLTDMRLPREMRCKPQPVGEGTDENVMLLIEAIVKQAASDYKEAYKKLRRTEWPQVQRDTMHQCELCFEAWLGGYGDEITRKLRRQVDEGRQGLSK